VNRPFGTDLIKDKAFQLRMGEELCNFRIVCLDDPDPENGKWYLLLNNSWWMRLLLQPAWVPACGRDSGSPGEFNWQVGGSGNPAYHFIYKIPEILYHRQSGVFAPFYRWRERLPNWPIIAEINLKEAWPWIYDNQMLRYEKFNYLNVGLGQFTRYPASTVFDKVTE